jgi:ABC-type nitrate/sulfonate/bicarbonate transport system substrate-binding protein
LTAEDAGANIYAMLKCSGKLKRLFFIFAILAVTLVPFLSCYSCSNAPAKKESITLGLGSSAPGFTPIYVAQNEGYFARNGLNVTIKSYASGQAAVTGLLNNEVNIAGSTEYPVVSCAFDNNPISILATMDKDQAFYVTGRKDLGILNVSDLKGKKIGLPQGTIAEFYLGRLLDLNGLTLGDVKVVNTNMTSAANAITSGAVAAVVVSQPYSYDIEQQLGSNGIQWPAQNGQSAFDNMVAGNTWIAANPKVVVEFLKALNQAEEFIAKNPAVAKATQQSLLNNTDDAFLDQSWPLQQFSLSLDESMIAAMEDEARWMIANNLTSQTQVPNFLNYIYLNGLNGVAPGSINIIQ